MRGAKGVIINITGGDDLKLMEVDEAASYIRDMVDGEANIIVGSAFDPALEGFMRVSVVATGIDASARHEPVQVPQRKPAAGAFQAQPSIFSMPLAETAPAPAAPGMPEPPAATADPQAVEPAAPEPTAEQPAAEEEEAIDLAAIAERVPDAPAASETVPAVTIPAAPVGPAVMPEPAPAPEPADDRPLTLFERMIGVSRKPRTPEPPATLAPPPAPAADTADDVPGWLRRQNNR
jgi:cell division protein FtsZ